MEFETPESPETPEPSPRVALVVTDSPVAIAVEPMDDERTPDGMVCLGTSLQGRLVARCVVPPDAAEFFEDQALFDGPVRLALAAEAAPPGLQCRLFALVTIPPEAMEEDDEEEEPWAESVPSSAYEREVRESGRPDGAGGQQAAVLLGHIVRFDRDRRHPAELGLEAADVLRSIVNGQVSEVVDKVLEDLLGDGQLD